MGRTKFGREVKIVSWGLLGAGFVWVHYDGGVAESTGSRRQGPELTVVSWGEEGVFFDWASVSRRH